MRKCVVFLDNAKLSRFDGTQAPDTNLDELSVTKIYDLLTRMGQRTNRDARIEEIAFDLLKNLGIADTFDGGNFPTIAGFLIFAKEKPQLKRSFSRYIIRCVNRKIRTSKRTTQRGLKELVIKMGNRKFRQRKTCYAAKNRFKTVFCFKIVV